MEYTDPSIPYLLVPEWRHQLAGTDVRVEETTMGPRFHQIRVEILGDAKIPVNPFAGELHLKRFISLIVSDRFNVG